MARHNRCDKNPRGNRRKPSNLKTLFSNNQMKLDTDKCHLLLNSQKPNALKLGDLHINNPLSESVSGINFDCKLKFNKHMKGICHKASGS